MRESIGAWMPYLAIRSIVTIAQTPDALQDPKGNRMPLMTPAFLTRELNLMGS